MNKYECSGFNCTNMQDAESLPKLHAEHSWVSIKEVGRPWYLYCPGCAVTELEAEKRRKAQNAEREKIRAHNRR